MFPFGLLISAGFYYTENHRIYYLKDQPHLDLRPFNYIKNCNFFDQKKLFYWLTILHECEKNDLSENFHMYLFDSSKKGECVEGIR